MRAHRGVVPVNAASGQGMPQGPHRAPPGALWIRALARGYDALRARRLVYSAASASQRSRHAATRCAVTL